MEKTQSYRLVTLGAPLLCVPLAFILILLQFRKLQATKQEQATVEQQNASLKVIMENIKDVPVAAKIPVVPSGPEEQPAFLNMLRGAADINRVQLLKFESKPPPPPSSTGETKEPTGPPNVTALASSVEVVGNYGDIRRFLYALLRMDRLYNTTDLKWNITEKYPSTHLSMTVTRYVGPAPAGTAASATSPQAKPAS